MVSCPLYDSADSSTAPSFDSFAFEAECADHEFQRLMSIGPEGKVASLIGSELARPSSCAGTTVDAERYSHSCSHIIE